MVYESVVAQLEDTLFYTNLHRVAVELLAQHVGPLVERLSLDGILHILHICLLLHVVSDSLETRGVPFIVLLVLLEESLQTGLVFCSLVPHSAVADFVEQQSVVIFLHEVFQVGVFLFHFSQSLVDEILTLCSWIGLGQRVELLVDDHFAQSALFDKAVNVGLHRVVGKEHALVFKLDDMIAEGRLYGFADIAFFHRVSRVFKLFHQCAFLQPSQFASFFCRSGILRVFLGQFGEVASMQKHVVYRVGALLCLVPFGLRIALSGHKENVGRFYQSAGRVDTLLGFAVDFPGLSLHVGVVDERWAHLLVAVAQKFLFERCQCVEFGSLGGIHFKFVVDKKRNVILHALLVDDPLGVVLIVGIFKFRPCHVLTIDGHDDGVVGLGCCRKC